MRCMICDQTMSQSISWLFSCSHCGFSASTLTAGGGRGVEGLESLRRRNFGTLCNWLDRRYQLAGKSLLEVGCAEGWFLEEVRRHGVVPVGIEPTFAHAEMSREKGFEVINGFFPRDIIRQGKFDFIVFNDVFEHLPDPISSLAKCFDLLAPGGVLVLNLPSNHGIFYRLGLLFSRMGRPGILERLWQKGFPSPHLSYFNSVTLKRFISRYSCLQHIATFSLDALAKDGLWDRVKTSHAGLTGRVIYACLRLFLPLFVLFPSDIVVGVFQKPLSE